MSSLNTQFEHELKILIKGRMADIGDILCAGQAVKDYAEYQRLVGAFQALRTVHEDYCEQVNTTLNQR